MVTSHMDTHPSAVLRRHVSTFCNIIITDKNTNLAVSTLVAIVCLILLIAEAPIQSHAGVCNNVQNNDGCNKNNVYSCVAANSPDCAEMQQCGIDYKRNFRTGSMLRIYLGAFGYSLSSCPSGLTTANDLGVVTEAIYMFTGETTCFRTDQVSISGSTMTIGGSSFTNFTIFGDTSWCANEKVFFKCNSNQMTISVGTQGAYWSSGWQGRSKTNNLCYSVSASWPPIRRGTQLIEDMYVEARVTRARGLSFCQGWGGTLMRATIPSVDSIIGQVGINDFHIGYESGVWLYDGATYSSSTDPPRTSTNAHLYLQGSNRTILNLLSANNRMNIVCTRTMSNVILAVPSRCYVGLACRVTATSTLFVQNYHTVSDSDAKVRYVDSSATVFEFSLSSTSALFERTFTSAGNIYAPTASLQGQGFIPTVTFSVTSFALETVTFPTGLILYQGKPNTFNITKTAFGTINTIALNSTASTIAGLCTTTGFGTGTTATMTCTPTNTAGSTVSVSLDVSSQCDCGYVCGCYVSPAAQNGISVLAPVSVTASTTSLLLLPSQQITVTVELPATPTAATTVGVTEVCGLTFNATSFSWVAGDTATTKAFTITAPSTITSVVSCTLVFLITNHAPQFNAPASLALVVGPSIVASYTALQSSMTQGLTYTFQIALTRVYAGRNVTITPVCAAATFSPTNLSFSPTTLTQSISITGSATSCGMLLNFTDVGASDAVVPASRALTFTNMKTILVSMPTLLYVGQTTDNTIAISSTFVGGEFVNILLQWNGTAGAATFSQASTFQLNATTPSVNVSVFAGGAVGATGFVQPASLEVSTSTPIFQIYALEPVWANFNVTFTSSARRVVLSSRLIRSGLVVNFRPLKKVTMVAPTIQTTTIGIDVSVSITVSEKPSPGSVLLAELQYGGSPSNIVLPPPTQWDSSATVLTRLLTFSGRSPTNLQVITVRIYNDPQYEIPSFSFNFMFEALLQMTVDMPLIVFLNQSAAFTLTLPATVSLSTTLSVSPLNVLSFTPSNMLNMVLQNSATGTMIPSQEREVTVSFALSADDAARVAVPASRKVRVASLNQVIVNAPSADIVVYIRSTIYVRTTVQLAVAPTNGSVVTVTPQLICPTGNIVTFTPSSVVFNASVSPLVLTRTVDIRGVIASPACSLLYAVSGSGYTSSPQSFTVETRDLHKIQLINAPTRVFLGAANRVILNVSLDSTVRMPLTDSISIAFASSSPCLTISPSALYWAAGNQEDLFKIAYVTATCIGSGLRITTSATASSIFTNLLPTTITLNALALQTVTVTESTTGSTDYFMFVGGAALDMDVIIPEVLADDESLTVTASYSGMQGSINIAPAVWTPSPLKPLTKKLLVQAVSVSPQARVKFIVTGPPRFNKEATGDGRLEVFGPKLVTATAPSVLVVGQKVLVKVTIEDLPYPGETIVVKPAWEGANTSLSWTPSTIQWVSTTIGRDQYFQFAALQQSGNFNLKLVVSGSYRYVTSAYSGEMSIEVPQVVTTSQLPMELTKNIRYSIFINIGKLPSTANTDIFVQLIPQLSDLGLECIQLDSSQVKFSSTNPLAPVEQQIGVSVIRACPQRVMTFAVLGAVEQYSRIVAPRYFTTFNSEPFGIEWPVAMYAGSEPQVAVITLRDIIYDQEQYANITILCNGSAIFTQNLYWGYGSKSEVVVEVSNNVSEIVYFSYNITSNFLTSALIPARTTSFLPLIRIQQVTDVPAQIYKGDANKLKVFFNVSSLPVQLGNTPGASFELIPESMAPEIRIQPARLMWSADSSVIQFIYIVGLSPTTGSVQIVFRVQGEGAPLVGQLPSSISVAISPLLLIDYSVAPKELYVAPMNSQVVNVTIPDNSSVTLLLSVGGETSAFTVSPSTLTFAANGARTQYFTITGVYATSRASYMIYTIASAASRIALRTMDASESMSVLALKTITQTPESLSYSLVVGEAVSVVVSPSVPNIRCTTTTTSFAVVFLNNNEILVTALLPSSAIITCTNPDTTFESLVPFTVTATSKKTISYPTFASTYVVVPGEVEAQQKFGVTLSSLPSKGMLVVEPIYDASVVKFPLVQLQFGQFTARTQYFFIKGLVLTNSTNITLRFSGTVSEYNLYNLPTSKCEVVNNLYVTYSLLGFLTDPQGGKYGYIAEGNAVRVQFQIPRQTLFSSIVVVPSNSDVKYCLSINPCIPITLGNPLLIGTQIRATAYVYSLTVLSNVTIGFTLTGGVDFRSPSSITIPHINFQRLEKIAIDTTSTKSSLYIGGQNAQSIWVSIPAAPLAGQSVELIVTSSAGIVVSSPLLTFAASSLGVMLTPMRQELVITGVTKGDNQSVTLQWRDRTAVTSATNYEDAIAGNVSYFEVKALIVFEVAVSNVALPTGYRTVPYTIYLGEVNALAVSISLPTMPVLSSTVVTVSVAVSNPDVFQSSASLVQFTLVSGALNTKSINIYAKSVYNLVTAANNSVTIRISGPPEYQQDISYGFSILAQPLLEMQTSLTSTTVAVGMENAVRFDVWPPVPVTLTLGSIVTCGEVSFSAAEALSWDASMTKKSVSVVGTLPTTATSSCFIRTPVTSGAWSTKFVSPPLNLQMWTKARPSVSSNVASVTDGTAIRGNGMTFTITISGGWFLNQTATSFNDWVNAGHLTIKSTRGSNIESKSVMAGLESQLNGKSVLPLITMSITSTNTLKIAIGPSSSFYASARETITIALARSAISTGVSLEPNMDSMNFEIYGKKESLVDSNVLGSGAASAAIAGGALSMGAATAAGKLQAIMNAFLCPNPDWRDSQNSMDWNEAPIPLSFGSNSDLGTYAAVAFSNSIVILGCFCVHMLVARIVFYLRKNGGYSDKTFARALAVVRFPSLLLFPMLFFYQSVVSASIKVVLYSPIVSFRAIGGITFVIVGFGVPGITYAVVGPGARESTFISREELLKERAKERRHAKLASEALAALNRDDPSSFPITPLTPGDPLKNDAADSDDGSDTEGEKKAASEGEYDGPRPSVIVRGFLYLFQYEGEWSHPDKNWVMKYGMFFDEFRGGYRWFILVDMLLTFALGIVDGFEPRTATECYGRLAASVFLFLIQWLSVVYCRPYINRFLNGFFIFAYFLQFLAMLLVAVALFNNTPDYDGVKIAVNLLILFSALLMLKAILDLLRVANDHFGIEAVFGDNDGVNAVHVRVKTEKESAATREEVYQSLIQEEETRRRVLFGDERGSVGSPLSRTLLMLPESRTPSSDQLDSLYTKNSGKKYGQRRMDAASPLRGNSAEVDTESEFELIPNMNESVSETEMEDVLLVEEYAEYIEIGRQEEKEKRRKQREFNRRPSL